jgi:hypothetical protein
VSSTSIGTITAAAFRLDRPGGAWAPIADAPRLNGRAKIGASAVVVAGEVYLIGGYTTTGFSETTEPRLFRYDPDADEYVELAEVPMEVDDTVPGVYQDRYLYLVSGWHGPFNRNIPNVQVYDTKTDAWAQATPIPAPLPGLFGHAGTIVGDRVVYMDGARSTGGFPITDRVFVGRIDPAGTGDLLTIAWTETTTHPGRPTYRAAASQGGTPDDWIVLVGGSDNTYNISGIGYDGQPSPALPQVLTWHPATDTWRAPIVYGAPAPAMDHRGLVPVDGGWVTIGGMTEPGVTTTRVTRYTLGPEGPLGDLDCDDLVGTSDLLVLLATWGPCPDPPATCSADINGDGRVDTADLLMLLARWS